ncbi:ArsO family NAD(P)H-dependent flavin-containing monooxygenase [Actinokineospora sp. PR83]|uniref:ArsO family NAD(P)H-dependent flavin-containing monooxygenase n=1 Tax=Actinokineospora sp. PR83 TaxID=2884908 RepID=UPI0027E06041|nr:ArsO family NAD(P)H-dependent flavin-containing monooxygenase [Actinokineospora sp. PR83]MCG8917715.1 ArsO family NAD(P)H-dependent flavin-containing monooxygenase [Actinokineospora sp. PR83]
MNDSAQVVVIGGGQAGLAAGYHLRRAGLDFTILDAQPTPGGAWSHGWNSLRLFSPARHSSLPGWPMPVHPGEGHPTAEHVVDYLTAYEKRYDLPIHRGETVTAVESTGDGLLVTSDSGQWHAGAVISATGTWWRPFLPTVPGAFAGRQLHAVDYRSPGDFADQRVVVVGGGNSGAQIAADLTGAAHVTWVTRRPPRYLPDDIDGRALFDIATRRRHALDRGEEDTAGVGGLGDIVAVPPVRAARDQGHLTPHPMFTRLDPDGPVWADGHRAHADTVIWCTGFRPALTHLAPLRLRAADGTVPTDGTRARGEPRLHLLGYGDWTGPASATLIGVGRTARDAAADISDLLGGEPHHGGAVPDQRRT